MTFDLEWDVKLRHRRGSATRLAGVDVYYEFSWAKVFGHDSSQFPGGQCLAEFVRESCPSDLKPALLLTLRNDVQVGFRQTPTLLVLVVNLPKYRRTHPDAARSYLTLNFGTGIMQISQLSELAASAAPEALAAFFASHLDLSHITEWASGNQERLEQLRGIAGEGDGTGAIPDLGATLAAVEALGGLDPEGVATIASFFGADVNRERRLELLRAITDDPSGRYVAGEVLAERTPQRLEDAYDAMVRYEALLEDETSTETDMQEFIEKNLWLLGLDYAVMRPRKTGPSGAMDFILQRFDGYHDLLELKSPQDEIVKAPDIADDDPWPSPSKYALSTSLAKALPQAHVYRDRLTRNPESSRELYGLPHSRDPRLIIVIGRGDSLQEHRQRVLFELNKSFHRVEIVPYDILARRAKAVLDNVKLYLLAAENESRGRDESSAN